ncbi:MAG: type II secretion system F family protein [Candidatus Omnitrophica bacterium]|nr:type II secretion system F family protein [Candidatus Omnitrophota bacterium]
MLIFSYKARDSSSKLVRGIIEAADELSAAVAVENLGLIPITISSRSSAFNFSIDGLIQFIKIRKISRQELLIFSRQLNVLISAGVPLIQSLGNVLEQTDNISFKEIISNIIVSLKNGVSFSDALSKYPQVFPDLYVSLIRVGESGGILDKVLIRLADLSTQEISMRSHLRSALVYPSVLAIVAFVIVNFVLIGILPRFVAIFETSSVPLPLPTKILLSLSYLLKNFWWLLLIGTISVIAWFRAYYRSSIGRYRVDSLILKIPVAGRLILKIMVSRLSRSVAALTKSGIPVLEALSVVESTVPNAALQGVVQNIRLAISHGQTLVEPVKSCGLFPPMVIQLIDTGERTGKLDEMFDRVANFYEPEIEFTIRNLTSLLEPAMLLLMGAVVAFIALSVLLPIFNLISVVRG